MNNSKLLIIFGFFILSSLFFNDVQARELANYNERIDGTPSCSTITTTTTGLTIEDGTEFDFVEGESYLLVGTSVYAGEDTANEYAVRILHGTTVFEGSEQIVEPDTVGGCVIDGDFHTYFWWTVWNPSNPTEAGEDISIEFEPIDGDEMYFDNTTFMVIHLDGDLITEGVDWFFAEDTTNTTLQENWATPNNATLNFTPSTDEHDWLILGSNQLDTGSGTVQYMTRLFGEGVNGTATITESTPDDAEEDTTDGGVSTTSSDLELHDLSPTNSDGYVGMRFTTVLLPQNATINSANIQFTVDEIAGGSSTPLTVTFRGEDIDDSAPFTTTNSDISNRVETTASVDWAIPTWVNVGDSGSAQLSADLSPIVEEIVGRAGWVSGNDLTIMIKAWNGTGVRTAESENTLPAPELTVEFVTIEQTDPVISQEGEDPASELFVQSFLYPRTLPDSPVHAEVQAQIDAVGGGTQERLYSEIFALDMSIFRDHDFFYEGGSTVLTTTEYGTELFSLDVNSLINGTNYFGIGDIGTTDTSGGDLVEIRGQLDNVDLLDGYTGESYDYNSEWDGTDILRWSFGGIRELTNGTHTLDVDASATSGTPNAIHYGAFLMSLDIPHEIANVTDTVIWSDSTNMTFNVSQNVTDTVRWSDFVNATFNVSQEITDIITWLDNSTATATLSQEVSDTIIWSDNATMIIDFNQEVSDSVTWSDNATAMASLSQVVDDDVVIWSDFVTIIASYSSDVLDGDIIWSDNINMTFNVSQEVTDPVIWNDFVNMTFNVSQEVTDTVIWNDNATGGIDASGEVTDIIIWDDTVQIQTDISSDVLDGDIIWGDFVNMTFNVSQEVSDTIIWNDNDTMTFDVSQVAPTDTVTWNDFVNMTASFSSDVLDGDIIWSDNSTMTFEVSLIAPTDTVSWSDFVEMAVTFEMDVDEDEIIWSDSTTGVITASAVVTDFIGWLDGAGYGFDPSDVPIIIINEGDTIINQGGTGGVGGNQPAPTIPDSDGDGLIDTVDACPLEAENFNQFQDSDGCPDTIPLVVDVPDVGLPLELTQFDVVDDNIVLEDSPAQPQVEDLTVRWLGDEPITITNVEVADSPFDIQFEDIPVQFGTSELGITETKILYTVQPPNRVCTNDFTFNCVDNVTYDIPVIITGEVDGKIIVTEGRIRVDNSDRTNPYFIILAGLFLIPILAILIWSRRRKPQTKLRIINKSRSIDNPRGNLISLDKKGKHTIREKQKLQQTERKPLIRERTNFNKKDAKHNVRLLNPKKKDEKRFSFRDPRKDKKKKKKNFLGR